MSRFSIHVKTSESLAASLQSDMKNVVQPLRIASVSFLNARPLIYGLENDPALALLLDVPSRLIDHLRDGRADVALLPTIDFQRLDGLKVIPSAGIGCNGPTLTVRLFAKIPLAKIQSVAVDPDSHTSVALARILLARRFGIRPEFVDRSRASERDDQAQLLIGDKVICEEPPGYPHQHDLGDEWKKMTGMPFVFAIWTARQDAELGDLPDRLIRSREQGLEHVPELIEKYAIPRGWPADLARQYLTEYLQFKIGPAELKAIEEFHRLCAEEKIIDRARPLVR